MSAQIFRDCRAQPKLSEVSADRLVLCSQPDIRHVAEAPLGSSVELSVMGVADDDTVQVGLKLL